MTRAAFPKPGGRGKRPAPSRILRCTVRGKKTSAPRAGAMLTYIRVVTMRLTTCKSILIQFLCTNPEAIRTSPDFVLTVQQPDFSVHFVTVPVWTGAACPRLGANIRPASPARYRHAGIIARGLSGKTKGHKTHNICKIDGMHCGIKNKCLPPAVVAKTK